MINFKRYSVEGTYRFKFGGVVYTHAELLEYLVNGQRISITTVDREDVTTESLAYIINSRFSGRPGVRDAVLAGFRKHFRNGVHNASAE